ncbi:glycosyltransferase [Antrihabitans sp. YC2-6]|uniref:glycosyltransferase n=1 Tax=Antrihabitans sp. YC2-6 TaxID=2799498 RepID=UPI0018F715CC|nr:glycosyltransferase [Antrihabitans sp. YC2-6]MBJ8348706.1 DUF1972 domain-containing protein [Antrihabitans sp. YC2-6]
MTKSVAIIGSRGYPSYYGGFETLVRRLAPYLVDEGWDVTVYGRKGSTTPDDPARDDRVKTATTLGIESKSISTLSYGLTSCTHAARRRPDVAFVLNVANGFFFPVLKARKIPIIVNVDGIEWEREKWGAKAKAAFRAGARMTAKHADEIVCDSQEIARRWKVDFDRDGVYIPYGGTDPGLLNPIDELSGHPYILMVARFVPENTMDDFLTAAIDLSKRWKVAIVGSSGYGGELDDRVAGLAANNANIHWFGHIHDDNKLFALWQHATVYFHGHSVGGTNPALVQAMASGAPVVARDTIYNREVLGESGLFVQADPIEITQTIDRLMGDSPLREQFQTQAKIRAKETYTWESVCAAYEQLLASYLPTRR